MNRRGFLTTLVGLAFVGKLVPQPSAKGVAIMGPEFWEGHRKACRSIGNPPKLN